MREQRKIAGLIVRTIDMGESDRILTVLTGEYGKISVFAKGVRSIRSHRLHTTQLFCYSEMNLELRGDRYYLGEVSPIEDFYPLREDIIRLSLAQYIAQVIGILTLEGEDQSEILRLTLNTLYLIAEAAKPLELIKGAFEFRLAALLGFMPNLSECGRCGKSKSSYALIPEDGIILCTDCIQMLADGKHPLPQILDLTPGSLTALRYVLAASEKRIFSFQLEGEDLKKFKDACEKYLLYHIDRGFETLSFYNTLTGE